MQAVELPTNLDFVAREENSDYSVIQVVRELMDLLQPKAVIRLFLNQIEIYYLRQIHWQIAL